MKTQQKGTGSEDKRSTVKSDLPWQMMVTALTLPHGGVVRVGCGTSVSGTILTLRYSFDIMISITNINNYQACSITILDGDTITLSTSAETVKFFHKILSSTGTGLPRLQNGSIFFFLIDADKMK